MTHPPRHSRPNARQQHDQYAVGPSLLDEVGSRPPRRTRKAQDEQRVEHAQQQQQHHAETDAEQDGAHASRMAPHSAGAQQMVLGASPRAAATSLPARVLHEAYGTGNALGGAMGDASTAGDSATGGAKAAASRATEDMHTLIRALKTDLSCMSVRLERLEALLSA